MEFVTVNQGANNRINIPQDVFQQIDNTLPRNVVLEADNGHVFSTVKRRIRNMGFLETDRHAIYSAYKDVDSVEVLMKYLQDGHFNVVKILHDEEDTDSHASDSTDSDYRVFLANYVSGDDVGDNEETEISVNGPSFGEDDN